jgi:hypothetical protein
VFKVLFHFLIRMASLKKQNDSENIVGAGLALDSLPPKEVPPG